MSAATAHRSPRFVMSCIAVGLAAERPVAGLVLEAPYTSAVELAAEMFPVLPVRLLMKDQLRSDQRIGSVHARVLILHGERDQAIAIDHFCRDMLGRQGLEKSVSEQS